MRRSTFAWLLAAASMSTSLLLAGTADAGTPRTPDKPRGPRSSQRAESESRPAMRSGLMSLRDVASDTPRDVHVARAPRGNVRASSSEVDSMRSVSRSRWTAPRFRPSSTRSVEHRIAASWPGDHREALRVAACESSLNPSATSKSGRYSGLFQFDSTTWRSVGGSGSPAHASVEEQTRRAWRLKQERGWSPWPACGRR